MTTIKNAPIRCAHSATVDPKILKPHPENPNRHGSRQLELFMAIIAYQGWRRPITVSKLSGFVTKGHGALAAALAGGCEQVPIDEQEYPNRDAELADIVADNQLQRMSQMDEVKLGQIVTLLASADGFDMTLTALPAVKLEKLTLQIDPPAPAPPAQDPAHAAAPIAPPPADGKTIEPVHVLQLFFTEQGIKDFSTMAEFFQRDLQSTSLGETVLAVMRSAFNAVNKKE